jgi:hypothetical protein
MHYPILSGQMPSNHVVRRQGISYSGHSCHWRIGGDMAIVAADNLQNHPLLILVS